MIYSLEPNLKFLNIAKQIHRHAGITELIQIHNQTAANSISLFKSEGPFDIIFIDHQKDLYLSDFKLIENNGGIQKGTVVVGDNIVYPGAPEYLQHFKDST